MSTISTVQIVNKALVLCGAKTISSLTEDTNNARVCNSIYELALRDILGECPWTFALSRATLSTTVASTTIPWYYTDESYVYTKPTVALLVMAADQDTVMREEGNYLITSDNGLDIKFTYYQNDASVFPPKFIDAFIDRLCVDICYTIINSSKKAMDFIEKYTKISLPKAMSANGQTGTQQQMKDDAWEKAGYSDSHPDC